MALLKTPLLSLEASGSLKNLLSFHTRLKQHIVRRKPHPPDARSLTQLSWRHMFQKAIVLWHALSPAEQQVWESDARRKHMSGYAYFISQALRPNPGLYLPLQGGVMSGNIDMDSNKIISLPAAVAAGEAVRYNEFLTHLESLGPHHYEAFEGVPLNKYLLSPFMATRYSNLKQTLVANRLYTVPYPVTRARTPDLFFIQIATADAVNSNLRLGLFSDTGAFYPGARLSNGGIVSVATTGRKTVAFSTQLPPGMYWLVFVADGTPQVVISLYWLNPRCEASTTTFYHRLPYYNGVYGDLPDPFPAESGTWFYLTAAGFRFTSND